MFFSHFKKNEQKQDYVNVFLIFSLISIYQLLFSNSFFLITEGWFTEYARLILLGKKPYKDFFHILPPTYVLLVAVIHYLFGLKYITLHYFGIVCASLQCIFIYGGLRFRFDTISAAIGSVAYFLLFHSFDVWMNFDFVEITFLFSTISFYLFLSVLFNVFKTKVFSAKIFIYDLLVGVFVAMVFLTKQSGVILFLAFFALYFIPYIYNKSFPTCLKLLGGYLLGVSLPCFGMIIYLNSILNGDFTTFFEDVFWGAMSAKGGGQTILFAFFKNIYFTKQFLYTLCSFIFFTALVGTYITLVSLLGIRGSICFALKSCKIRVARYIYLADKARSLLFFPPNKNFKTYLFYFAFASTIATCIYLSPFWISLLQGFYKNIYASLVEISHASIFAFVFYGLYVFYKDIYSAIFFITIGFLSFSYLLYTGASMHGIHVSAVAMLFSVIVSSLYSLIKHMKLTSLVFIFAFSFLALLFMNDKLKNPYSWWGVNAEDTRFRLDCKTSPFPLLDGICLTTKEEAKIQRVVDYILKYSDKSEPIYCYPHIPVFYTLTERYPLDGAVQSWFDFFGDLPTLRLANDLMQKTPPVIIVAELPYSVLKEHEIGFKSNEKLAQRDILKSIANLCKENKIILAARIYDLNGINISVYIRTDRFTGPSYNDFLH
ncbi:hypothetical protein NY78_4436 [Desulfovibrio sp. TomC]|nr:hypothetical protein NY78_4436 [Desulfovibrio sp. TomC]